MTPFQLAIFIVLSFLFVATVVATQRRRLTRRAALWFTLLWVTGAIVAIWPDVTSKAASLMGIGRGVDLVLYCAILFMMAGFLFMYIRLRRLRQNITVLVRRLAIMEAERRIDAE